MTSRIVIGLDISTSCTGVCCLNELGEILFISPIDLTKKKTFIEKCSHVKEELEKISKTLKIDEVFIEQNLSSFRRGLSSAHTINTLARFNGACDLISYQVFGIEAKSLNVTNARNYLKIKIDHKDKTLTTKQKVFNWVDAIVEVDWPKKKSGENKETSFDMADAYVVAKAGMMGCKE